VLDLTAETNAPRPFREHAHYHNLPLLDLVPLKPEHITAALNIIREQRGMDARLHALPARLQRSALIAAHWLVESRAARDLDEARQMIRKLEPRVVI
jgi:protein-tyrosine phosphatase